MQLPYSEELNIGYLSKLFENTTNCYKFFWFQAILRKMDGVRSRFTFDELINEMIADAWYMVTEYHLRLGPLEGYLSRGHIHIIIATPDIAFEFLNICIHREGFFFIQTQKHIGDIFSVYFNVTHIDTPFV